MTEFTDLTLSDIAAAHGIKYPELRHGGNGRIGRAKNAAKLDRYKIACAKAEGIDITDPATLRAWDRAKSRASTAWMVAETARINVRMAERDGVAF